MYVGAGRAAGADRDATARELAQVTQSVFGVRFDGEQTVGKALQHATGFGQAHATRQSLEQADADTALEFGELLGNRGLADVQAARSEEHTSELQSLMRISYAVFCLKKKRYNN